jgi:hypothetical protein
LSESELEIMLDGKEVNKALYMLDLLSYGARWCNMNRLVEGFGETKVGEFEVVGGMVQLLKHLTKRTVYTRNEASLLTSCCKHGSYGMRISWSEKCCSADHFEVCVPSNRLIRAQLRHLKNDACKSHAVANKRSFGNEMIGCMRY